MAQFQGGRTGWLHPSDWAASRNPSRLARFTVTFLAGYPLHHPKNVARRIPLR